MVVYYAPPVCCGPVYYGGHYYKTTQYWPAVRPYRYVSPYWSDESSGGDRAWRLHARPPSICLVRANAEA